ncbi:MAG: trehalose-phosphatase [Acetobacter sp.]|uniref:trehalose-phosphatase n=1 Tax=Acetobacter sp. TaxID=440 RepID=UPI0039E989F7
MFGFLETENSRFQSPPLSEAAFLLDFDGTLVDASPLSESVSIPPDLPGVLTRLRAACGDALAVISRRPIAQIDQFLGDIPFAVAGEHGVTIRHRPGGPVEHAALPVLPQVWLNQARDLVGTLPGTRLEHVAGGLVLHYRAAPEAAQTLHAAVSGWVRDSKGAFRLVAGKMAWEVRATGLDKGYAVTLLMENVPFLGRKPVYVGDDATDEDGVEAARRLGGVGLRIGADFPTPEVFRAWLAFLADGH